MIKIKNKTNTRITFPVLSFSIGPNEVKEINLHLLDKVLHCKDIVEVEKKKDLKVNNITKNRVRRS